MSGDDDLTVQGFDVDGEPEIRQGDNGLEIMFNFMPPSNGQADGVQHPVFDRFDDVLSAALGVEVVRDDRELFIIPDPAPDTAGRAKAYLESFWQDAWPALSKSAK
jgi:hypothetical protein